MESIKEFDYDFFVIGGGSGGLSAALRAASFGKKVAVADFVKPTPQGISWGLGGTCLNVGCIPKKLMHFTSLLGETRDDLIETGWNINKNSSHSWEKMVESIHNHIRKSNWGNKKQLSSGKVEYFNALASFVDKNTLALKDKKGEVKKVTAKYILVAVGGRPNYLSIEGAREYCITSDDIFWKTTPPGKTLVVGAGYIGLECGGFLKGLGYEVDIMYRSAPLRGFDTDFTVRIVKYMTKMGINFIQSLPTKITKEENGKLKVSYTVTVNGVSTELTGIYDTVLLAIGRTADTASIGLHEIGVKLRNDGKVIVDTKWRSSVDNVFAIGDITSTGKELTPVAIKEGNFLVQGLFQNNWKEIDYVSVPTTVFTPLEYSCCGLTEEQAILEHGDSNVDAYHSNFKPLEWTFNENHDENICYVKIVINKTTRKLLGIHYLGPNAGEVMQGYAIVLRKGLTYEDVRDTIGIHPTTAEELVTLSSTKKENPNAEKESC